MWKALKGGIDSRGTQRVPYLCSIGFDGALITDMLERRCQFKLMAVVLGFHA